MKKNNKETEYKMTIEEVVNQLEHDIKINKESQEFSVSRGDYNLAMSFWNYLQASKILLCRITGKEFVCEGIPSLQECEKNKNNRYREICEDIKKNDLYTNNKGGSIL